MSDRQPLSTLLSQALVAFIIEFDNEFEHQAPHRTTNRGATPGSVGASPLLQGLHPYPDNWRASLPMPEVLPHFPMVLHRGGFPDGS
ncbi:MAG: hypothetical protein WBL41_02645 [Terracidiphilus sp.]